MAIMLAVVAPLAGIDTERNYVTVSLCIRRTDRGIPYALPLLGRGHNRLLTCRRSTIGGRAFPVAGAKVWNGLPSDAASASLLSVFKNKLKTYLFRRCYETV